MNNTPAKQRIEYFDHLRLLATFMVIVIHVSGPYWYTAEISSPQWQILNLLESLSRWSVPVFFMISGTLFLGSSRDIRVILRKNLLRIVTAFLFWSAVYIGICFGKGQYTPAEAFREFLAGYYHMWYLYAIAGLYLAVPILRMVAQSRQTMHYFLAMAFLFGCLLPQGAIFLGLVSPEARNTAERLLSLLSFQSVCGYSLYFVLGYCLHSADISPRNRKILYSLGAVSLLATVLLSGAASRILGQPVHVFLEYMTPNVFFVSAAVFVFARYNFRYGRLSPALVSLLQKLSVYSFGVYLVHPLLYDVLRYNLGVDLMACNPLLSVPAASLGLMVVSYGISAVLNRIPLLKKYIV